MTRKDIAKANARHFPDGPIWRRHCELLARLYDDVDDLPYDLIRDMQSGEITGPLSIREGGKWDGRRS